MPSYVWFIIYCVLTSVVLYAFWQCVFGRFKKHKEKSLEKFVKLQSNEILYDSEDIMGNDNKLDDSESDNLIETESKV